ncbi:hypothetical protein ACH4SK_16375 [Streptomyces inhibens]|uniref:hypothetical protein n=1 Tax=Streptomyces inhibens TaxID=2293571 RepID=UPI0037BB67BF
MHSTAARRKVLAWRRAAHAERPAEVVPELLAEVRSHLTGSDTTALGLWTEWAAVLSAARARLRTVAAEVGSQEEQALRVLLNTPALANALAVVSPVFSRRVRQLGPRRLSHSERLTAYRYAVRAALKTSPLSSLTELAPYRPEDRARVRTSLHPLILHTVLRSAAPRIGIREQLSWRANASWRTGAHGTWLSEPQLHAGNGFGWSNDEIIDVRRRSELAEAVREPGELAPQRLARHLDSGLVGIDDPCPQGELLDWLTAALATSADACARRAGTHLATAGEALARMEKGDAHERTHALAKLNESLRLALRALGTADDWPLTAVTPVYEDRADAVSVPLPGPSHRSALRHYAAAACDALGLSPAYRAMAGEFVSRFGPGGVCPDVFAFCQDLARTGWPYTTEPALPEAPPRPGRSSC